MKIWKDLKTWKKGAIIGGIWGLISIFQRFFNPGAPIFYDWHEKITFFPYWFEMTVIAGFGHPIGIIQIIWPVAMLVVLLTGALIGGLIGYIYGKWKGK